MPQHAANGRQEEPPGPALGTSLGLIALFFLPLLGGGYSGPGYQVGFVLLPLAAAIAWGVCSQRPRLAILVLALYLLSGIAMAGWVQEGRLLWYYLLHLPAAWIVVWTLLRQVPRWSQYFLPVVTISAVLTALYGLYDLLRQGTVHYQVISTFGLHNSYAGYLLLAWPAAVAGALQRESYLSRWLDDWAARRTANKTEEQPLDRLAEAALSLSRLCERLYLERWLYALAGLLLAVTLVLTYSRASWVAFALQIAVFLALAARHRLRAGAGGHPVLAWFSGGVIVALAGLLLLPPVRAALASITNLSGYSMQGRLRYWSAAWEIFKDNPLAGIGPGNFAYVYPQYQLDYIYYSVDPHSWPLQLLCELGLVGALILLGVLAGTIWWMRGLWRATNGSPAAILLIVAVGGSMLHAAADFDYTFGATTALMGALLAYGTHIAADSRKAVFPVVSPLSRILPALTVILLLVAAVAGEMLTAERYNLDRLRDAPSMPTELKIQLLGQCIKYNRFNFRTHYQMARLSAESSTESARDDAMAELEKSIKLNQNYPPAYALRGLLARPPSAGEADLVHAIEIDPFNYPQHYYYHAGIAEDDETRLERLRLGMERVPILEPIRPDHVRPTWYELNPLFAEWWLTMSRLTDDEDKKAEYRKRAVGFQIYWDGVKNKYSGMEGGSSL